MWINKPYHRNYRDFIKWPNSGYNSRIYIIDKEYSNTPEHYLRAFFILQNDLQKLFEYIEPDNCNNETYSYRVHELFMRVCIEVEANFKAIFKENIYSKKENNRNIDDYKKIDTTHHLSSYKVALPIWNEWNWIFQPFSERINGNNPSRYSAYNESKHDRQWKFKQANFRNLINAFSGLLVLLSAQFRTEEFSPAQDTLGINTDNYYNWIWTPAIGNFFRIEFPNDWEDGEKYEFNWNDLKEDPNRFQKINYDNI